MELILLLAALICSGVATIMGFGWFGSDATNLLGWLSLSLFFFFAYCISPKIREIK